jgi:hypothetical protein
VLPEGNTKNCAPASSNQACFGCAGQCPCTCSNSSNTNSSANRDRGPQLLDIRIFYVLVTFYQAPSAL